jgi:tetratricopeptide (TPR) repeat protein
MVLQAHAVYPPALIAYERAIRLEPKEFAWRYYYALVVWQLSGPEKALAPFGDALKLRPDYTPAILKKADLLYQLGRFQESAAAYGSVPSEAEALYGMGRVKYAQHDLPAAEDFYVRACRAFPMYGAAYYGLAVTQRGLGRESEAAKNFELAQRYDKDHPPSTDSLAGEVAALATGVYRHLVEGDRLAHQGNVEEAAKLNEGILSRDPQNFTAILNLLYLARFVDRPAGQIDDLYSRAAKINPEAPVIYVYYGAALAHQGKFDAASTAARKAIELRPDFTEAHVLLGELMEGQNHPAEAIEQYRLARSSEPRLQLKLWRLLIIQGRSSEAIPEMVADLHLDDQYSALRRVLLGEAYLTTGDFAKARQYLEQARSRAPEMAGQIDQELEQIARRR